MKFKVKVVPLITFLRVQTERGERGGGGREREREKEREERETRERAREAILYALNCNS